MGTPPTTTTPTQPQPGDRHEPDRMIGLTFAAEHGLVGSREIIFATRNLPPPSELYVTQDDGLYITITNILGGVSVNVAAQLLLPDGRLSSNLFTVQPPATGTPTTYLFGLAEGYLFNVTVQPVSGVRRGSTWISVAIRRGSMASGVTLQTLIQDYVDSFSGPTWPGGDIRISTEATGLFGTQLFTNVAASPTWYFTVPANTRMQLRNIYTQFTTSAAVASRALSLVMYDATSDVVYQDPVEPSISAGNTAQINWAAGLGWAQSSFYTGSMVRGMPTVPLGPGYQVSINVWQVQAADKFPQICLSYEQWFST